LSIALLPQVLSSVLLNLKSLEGFFELAFPLAVGRPTFSKFKQSVFNNLTVTEGDTPLEGFVDVTNYIECFRAIQEHFVEILRILRISSLPRGQATFFKRLYEKENENWLVMGPLGCGKSLILAVQLARAAYTHIREGREGLAAVALFPTRESAKATEILLRALTFDSGVNLFVAIGGKYSAKQLVAMARTIKPHIPIGTPGKVVDLLKTTKATPFASIRLFALDEANDLLSESKLADVHTIRSYLKAVPTQAYA
ncbi:hypothetical protein KCU67_g8855, partial [Aureobasidium melanogenum]